jgi:hypothetical protein
VPNLYDLNLMERGWFIGPFSPTVFNTDQFECAVKRYIAGDREERHAHKIATEYTVIVMGKVRMNGIEYCSDQILEILPGEATDFEALTDVITFVVKIPAVLGDKYVVRSSDD